MKKTYVKPNTNTLAVEAAQLMAGSDGINNGSSPKIGVAGNTINSGFDEEYDKADNAKPTAYGWENEDAWL